MHIFFFFQAEDGIRDIGVTGVQTCALPIWSLPPTQARTRRCGPPQLAPPRPGLRRRQTPRTRPGPAPGTPEIGRASCRERVKVAVVGVGLRMNDAVGVVGVEV